MQGLQVQQSSLRRGPSIEIIFVGSGVSFASSSAAMYSRTGRIASSRLHQSIALSPFRQRSRCASALMMLASVANPSPRTQPPQSCNFAARSQKHDGTHRSHESDHDDSLRTWSDQGTLSLQTQTAEPAVSQIQMHFFTKTTLGTNAKAVANDQHSHDQLRID